MLNRLLVRSFDTIVVTSRYAQREFQTVADAVGCPMRAGAAGRRPRHVPTRTRRPRRVDGLLRLTHVGRLSREKSPHLAVATAVELHRRGVPLRMDVYGEGPHARRARSRSPATAPVAFHGFVEGRDLT